MQGSRRTLAVDREFAPAELGLREITITRSPLLGQPDYYVVSLRTLDDVHDAEGNRLSRQRTIASFSTRNTSLTVPAGLLELGKSYVIVVSAAVGIEPGAGQAYTHEGASSRVSTGLCTP